MEALKSEVTDEKKRGAHEEHAEKGKQEGEVKKVIRIMQNSYRFLNQEKELN